MQLAVTKQRTIWENIILIIALDSLHNNFEMTTAFPLYSDDKNLEDIQEIVKSSKVANLVKCIVKVIMDLTLLAKKKQSKRAAMKSKLGEKCFNYGKKSHYTKEYYSSILNKKKPAKESTKKAKYS